jgi:hypothetical protein
MDQEREYTQFTALIKKCNGLCDQSFGELTKLLLNGWTIINGTAISPKERERPHGGILYILQRTVPKK